MTSHSKMLKAKDIAERLGVSESAIYKWVGEGTFPKPYKLGNGDARRVASRWDEADIRQWLEDRRDS